MIDFANVKEITIGGSAVKKIMRGSDVLWEKQQPQPVGPDYLCFTAAEANSTVSMSAFIATAPSVSLEYSNDKDNWSPFTVGSTVVTLANVGDKMFLRGDNTGMGSGSTKYNYFVMTGKIEASGNVMSLLDKTVEKTSLSTNQFCFIYLFKNCSSLIKAPKIPATELGTSCYESMFRGCSSLVVAPKIPTASRGSTVQRMYINMFRDCSSLNSIEVEFTEFPVSSGMDTDSWLSGVEASGTFYCPSALDTSTRDESHVPAGWTVVNV